MTRSILFLILVLSFGSQSHAQFDFNETKRVVFLGDSITYSGQYVAHLELWLEQVAGVDVEYLNIGLPSETISGLSEPGHAGGRFPRPDLHERLDRVLQKLKPDLIVANYGMNCGIYHPYSDERFDAFRDGIQLLHEKAVAAGAKVIHVTPPVFDPYPGRNRLQPAGLDEYRRGYLGYDDVLDLYSAWLIAKRGDGWKVIDSHSSMDGYLQHKRFEDPEFILAKDGVHINEQGHYLIAKSMLEYLGVEHDAIKEFDLSEAKKKVDAGLFNQRLGLIKKRQRLWSNYWLNEVGHKRPGMAGTESLEKVQDMAKALDEQISNLAPLFPQED